MAQLTTELDAALSDFEAALDRIERLANQVFKDTSIDPSVRDLNETQQSGCTVLLTGFFEEFLKGVIRHYLCALPRTGIEFSKLPKKLRQTHYEGGGRVLSDVVGRAARNKVQFFAGISADDVVYRLYSPANSNVEEYAIVWEAFADTKQSPTSDTVSDLLKGVDIREVWTNIHDLAGRSTLATQLGELVERRNECAHTGRNRTVPTAPQILEYVDTLRLIGRAIVKLLSQKLGAVPCAADPYAWR